MISDFDPHCCTCQFQKVRAMQTRSHTGGCRGFGEDTSQESTPTFIHFTFTAHTFELGSLDFQDFSVFFLWILWSRHRQTIPIPCKQGHRLASTGHVMGNFDDSNVTNDHIISYNDPYNDTSR